MRGRRHGPLLQEKPHRLGRVERVLARQKLVENEPERVEIAPVIDRHHAERRFGRHVSDGSQDDARRGQHLSRVPRGSSGGGASGHLRQLHLREAEVDELHQIVRAVDQHDVRRA